MLKNWLYCKVNSSNVRQGCHSKFILNFIKRHLLVLSSTSLNWISNSSSVCYFRSTSNTGTELELKTHSQFNSKWHTTPLHTQTHLWDTFLFEAQMDNFLSFFFLTICLNAGLWQAVSAPVGPWVDSEVKRCKP